MSRGLGDVYKRQTKTNRLLSHTKLLQLRVGEYNLVKVPRRSHRHLLRVVRRKGKHVRMRVPLPLHDDRSGLPPHHPVKFVLTVARRRKNVRVMSKRVMSKRSHRRPALKRRVDIDSKR